VAFKVLKEALACGAKVWNGADFYGTPDANSLHLLNRYFTKFPEDADKVVLCVKSGMASLGKFEIAGSAQSLRKSVDACNKVLDGKKFIDLFACARVDPKVPVEDTIEALGQLVKEGKIGGIALSEVKAQTIRRAAKVHPIEMVEAEVSLWATDIFSNGVAEACAELGIVVVAHSPLGGGMLAGKFQKPEDLANDHHRFFPRFQGENFQKNLNLVKELQSLANAKGCTTPQLAVTWIKVQRKKPGMPFMVTIPGASSESRVRENCTEVELTDEDLKEIDSILHSFPVIGDRYPAAAKGLAEY
jgi:pyridoxine 4-dehydrogenase